MKTILRLYFLGISILMVYDFSFAQEHSHTEIKKDVKITSTSVKNQSLSGTCWSFATVSFLESELIRQGKAVFDLSEMYFARLNYIKKLEMNYRMQGNSFFTPGGQAHQVMNIIRESGIVLEADYNGRPRGETEHNHRKLDTAMVALMRTYNKKSGNEFNMNWKKMANDSLDKYLGELPSTTTYARKAYFPDEFSKDFLEINPDDYIEITSYTHHSFYTWFCLEDRFNWDFGRYFNVPLNEFEEIVDKALEKGFTVVWDGDVSEGSFDFFSALAQVPEKDSGQKMRQKMFDNRSTKVDHLMHITGRGYADDGTKYYLIKNSWGRSNLMNGYIWMSENYFRLKTVAIMVHKDCLSRKLKRKL